MDQSYSLNPAWLQQPDTLELSGLGKYTTLLGQAQQATNRNIAAPFIDANLQGLNSNVQDTLLKNQEYASQPFTEARRAGAAAEVAKSQEQIAQGPMRTQILGGQAKTSDSDANLKLAQNSDALTQVQDLPRQRMSARMATIYNSVKSKEGNAQAQAQAYAQGIQSLIDTTDDPRQKAMLRQELANPHVGMQHLEAAYNETVNSVVQQQKLAQEHVRADATVKAAQITAAAHIAAAKEGHKDYDRMTELELLKQADRGEPIALQRLGDFYRQQGDMQKAQRNYDLAKQAQQNRIDRASAGARESTNFKREIINGEGPAADKARSSYVDDLITHYTQ